jgi:hypothetical protein
MMSLADISRGEAYVYALGEADRFAGRAKKATVVKIESVVPEGKKRGVKLPLCEIEGHPEPTHVALKDLHGRWAPYEAHHVAARKAARDARSTAEAILDRLVALQVIEAPPTDAEVGEGKGGANYWVGPVRYRHLLDSTPKGVELHLSPLEAERLLAAIREP